MHCLFIDLASHAGLLACVTERTVIARRVVDHRLGDAELIPAVESVLADAGWTWGDIDRVACAVGPGGFTSLRMAVALANALVHERQIGAAGVHLADLYAARANGKLKIENGKLLWMHSTKAQEIFVCGGPWKKPEHVTIDQVAGCGLQVAGLSWCGELLPAHREIVEAMGLTEASLRPMDDVLPGFLARLEYGRELLLPWYGREG